MSSNGYRNNIKIFKKCRLLFRKEGEALCALFVYSSSGFFYFRCFWISFLNSGNYGGI